MIACDRRTWLALVAAAAVMPSGAADLTHPPSGRPTMKTHNLGRQLIDLPQGFEVLPGSDATLYFGLTEDAVEVVVELLARVSTTEDFTARVQQRVAELAAARHRPLNRPMLIRERAIDRGRLHLLRSYKNGSLTDVFRSEVFCRAGTAMARLETRSEADTADATEQRLLQMATEITAADPATAAGRGFCIGALVIATRHDQEIASVHFRSPAVPEVLITYWVNALAPNPDPSLLARWDQNRNALAQLGPGMPAVLRRGPVSLAGMAGSEELLTRSHVNGRFVFQFNAESRRPHPALATPLLSLTLDTEPTGRPETWPKPGWDEAQALAVWDAAVHSLRPRAGAV
jgi:hypothetical protein